jgi:hypothetical protein
MTAYVKGSQTPAAATRLGVGRGAGVQPVVGFPRKSVGTGFSRRPALDQDAGYRSPNFFWFNARLPQFV